MGPLAADRFLAVVGGMVTEERRWRAMGTSAHAVVVAHDCAAAVAAVDAVVADVARLEARWSRFLAGSDISRVNAAAGTPVAVSAVTVDVVRRALAARRLTGGRFDPTVLATVVANGYDRSFDQLDDRPAVRAAAPAGAEVLVDEVAGTVAVAAGAGLDLGGIGKGRAADLAAERAVAIPGVSAVLVNLGGDLRTAGGTWDLDIDDPLGGAPLASIRVGSGGVATSSTRKRAWVGADGVGRNHVVDPATGASVDPELASVTVLAGTGAEAEVLATAALVAGPDLAPQVLADAGVPALLVTDTDLVELGGFDRYRTGAER